MTTSQLDMPELPFPVIASAGSEPRARAIAARTERAHRWMTGVLGFSPRVVLHVLGPEDWAELARIPVYGFPHPGADGVAIFVAATDSALFDEALKLIVADLPASERPAFDAVYGSPPSLGRFIDLLALHELAHLYHLQLPFDIPRRWLKELFCNVALEGYLADEEPDELPVVETLARAALHIDPQRMPVRELERMDEADELNYSWFELRFHEAAIRIWQAGGRELLKRMYDTLAADFASGRETKLDDIHPTIGDVERTWPGRPGQETGDQAADAEGRTAD
jgi:hypothetical protein